MNLQLSAISKINSLPENLLEEFNNFIDYLAIKYNNPTKIIQNWENIAEILEREKKLLENEVRSNQEEIKKYLESGFVEFCSSGKIYQYTKGDVFDLNQNSNISYEIIDFQIKELSPDNVLAMYKVQKSDLKLNTKQISLRSSIWQKTNDEWKIIFHQGTNIQ